MYFQKPSVTCPIIAPPPDIQTGFFAAPGRCQANLCLLFLQSRQLFLPVTTRYTAWLPSEQPSNVTFSVRLSLGAWSKISALPGPRHCHFLCASSALYSLLSSYLWYSMDPTCSSRLFSKVKGKLSGVWHFGPFGPPLSTHSPEQGLTLLINICWINEQET